MCTNGRNVINEGFQLALTENFSFMGYNCKPQSLVPTRSSGLPGPPRLIPSVQGACSPEHLRTSHTCYCLISCGYKSLVLPRIIVCIPWVKIVHNKKTEVSYWRVCSNLVRFPFPIYFTACWTSQYQIKSKLILLLSIFITFRLLSLLLHIRFVRLICFNFAIHLK